MKRDLDLCRDIMDFIGRASREVGLCDLFEDPEIARRGEDAVWYHLWLLEGQGFVDCSLFESDDGAVRRARIRGLTWDGQDFLDSVSDPGVWRKVSKALSESVGSTTFDVVKAVAVKVATDMAMAAVARMA